MKRLMIGLILAGMLGCTPTADTGTNADGTKAETATSDSATKDGDSKDSTKDGDAKDSSSSSDSGSSSTDSSSSSGSASSNVDASKIGLSQEDYEILAKALGSCMETLACVGPSASTSAVSVNTLFKTGEAGLATAQKTCDTQAGLLVGVAPQCKK